MTEAIEALQERIARAICLSKQGRGDSPSVAAQYVDTFWRDYLPEARIAVSAAADALSDKDRELAEARKTEEWLRNEVSRIRSIHLKPDAHVAPSLEAIQSAIRETEYKYFGDYELSDEQWDAVITLIYAAKHLAAERTSRESAERERDEAMAALREKEDRVKALEEALRPFSVGAEVFYRNEPDEKTISMGRWTEDHRFYADVAMTVGHIRRAQSVLENSKAGLADANQNNPSGSREQRGNEEGRS